MEVSGIFIFGNLLAAILRRKKRGTWDLELSVLVMGSNNMDSYYGLDFYKGQEGTIGKFALLNLSEYRNMLVK